MTVTTRAHDDEHSEFVIRFALHALESGDVSAAEARLSSCAECRRELEELAPVVASFVSWPIDVLRPSPSLWSRLAQRIAAETGEQPLAPAPERWVEPEWSEVAPGISCKLLATDTEHDRVSMLVRLAPGTHYPSHRHAGVEELYLLHGTLIVDDEFLRAGDSIRAEAGSVDRLVWSETGCTCLLLTSTRDELR